MKTSDKKKGRAGDVDAYVGARLKTLRLARGCSQEELARNQGVTFQQIQKYENGTNRMSAGALAKAAKTLGVPVQSFFPDEYTDTRQLDLFQAELVAALSQTRDTISTMIKRLGGKAA